MADDMNEAIVLQDDSGRYYVIPTEALEDSLVPEDSKSAIDSDMEEVAGYSNHKSFSYVGNLSLSTTRVKSSYGFRANAWPCDTPVAKPGTQLRG